MGLLTRSKEPEPRTPEKVANVYCPDCQSGRVQDKGDNAAAKASAKVVPFSSDPTMTNFVCNECVNSFGIDDALTPDDVGEAWQ